MDRPLDSEPSPRAQAAMWNLRIDAATGEVVQALSQAGIDSVVLKGPALADWYTPESVRTYVDGDIWVAPVNHGAACEVLKGLGFVADLDEGELPEWWLEHAGAWRRASDRVAVDLHRYLQGVTRDPAEVWGLIWPTTETVMVGGESARRLPAPARALYVTLHAAHHGAGYQSPLAHLNAALAAAGPEVWADAAALAAELGAVDMLGAGLRLVPEGAQLASALGLPGSASVRTVLQAGTPPPVALGFDQLAKASGADRVRIVSRKLVPPPAFMRHWWPPARRNRAMLTLAYLYRPVWLLIHAPAGYRAWRAARRQVDVSSDFDDSSSR